MAGLRVFNEIESLRSSVSSPTLTNWRSAAGIFASNPASDDQVVMAPRSRRFFPSSQFAPSAPPEPPSPASVADGLAREAPETADPSRGREFPGAARRLLECG